MKSKLSAGLDIAVFSINYIIISYALSNVAMLLASNPLFILFFASEIWLLSVYWERVRDLSKSKLVASVLVALCLVANAGLLWFTGAPLAA